MYLYAFNCYCLMKVRLTSKEVENLTNDSNYEFPKYTSQVINWANQNAQGPRAKVVGQMSELIQEFDGRTLNEWIEWYDARMPNAIENATEKIYDMVEKIRNATPLITKEMVREWVKDLVYTKTFCGLKVQQAVIAYIAKKYGVSYRMATPDEESKGIDGYVGNKPIQIKASTYKTKSNLPETINVPIVYYEKTASKDWVIEYNPHDFVQDELF